MLGVIVRRREKGRARETSERWRFNLEATDLRGADLKGGHFERALLGGAHLEWAVLLDAHLERVSFMGRIWEGPRSLVRTWRTPSSKTRILKASTCRTHLVSKGSSLIEPIWTRLPCCRKVYRARRTGLQTSENHDDPPVIDPLHHNLRRPIVNRHLGGMAPEHSKVLNSVPWRVSAQGDLPVRYVVGQRPQRCRRLCETEIPSIAFAGPPVEPGLGACRTGAQHKLCVAGARRRSM